METNGKISGESWIHLRQTRKQNGKARFAHAFECVFGQNKTSKSNARGHWLVSMLGVNLGIHIHCSGWQVSTSVNTHQMIHETSKIIRPSIVDFSAKPEKISRNFPKFIIIGEMIRQ